jgi:hypothetical protein
MTTLGLCKSYMHNKEESMPQVIRHENTNTPYPQVDVMSF